MQHSQTDALMRELFGRLSLTMGAPTDEYAIRQWREEATKVFNEIGEKRFREAVTKWCANQLYFPRNPYDLKDLAPEQGNRCVLCRNTGGLVYGKFTRKRLDGNEEWTEGMTRCHHPGK